MPRESTIPAQTVREEIRTLEEYPAHGVTPGIVRALVGRVDEAGDFIVPQQFVTYTIEGEQYDELCGPPPAWAPDKPAGTYRNEDLWHFIDLMRNA